MQTADTARSETIVRVPSKLDFMTGTQQRSGTVNQTHCDHVLHRTESSDDIKTVSHPSRRPRLPIHLQRSVHIPLSPSLSIATDFLLGVSQKMATITLRDKGSGSYTKHPLANRAETLSGKKPTMASPGERAPALCRYETESERTWAIELSSYVQRELRRPRSLLVVEKSSPARARQ